MINPLPPKRFYTMDEDGDIFEATDPDAWREWMEMTDRSIKRTMLPEGCTISTAFTGRNAEWDPNKPPLLFETMVFDGPMNEYRELYQTRNMAEKCHDQVVQLVKMKIEAIEAASKTFECTAK